MRVLLIEDNRSTQYLCTQVLEALGHEVVAYPDAESAWVDYQHTSFPLIVTDWMLPGMSGLELCQKVRQTPAGSGTVVLVITARHSKEDLETVLNAGADDYLTKPIDVGLLRIRLAIAQQRVRTLDERARAQGQVGEIIQELEQSHQDLQSILHQLPMGTALADAQGHITFISQVASQQFFGGRGHDVLGKRWQQAFPFSAEDSAELRSMARRPPDKRQKVAAHVERRGGQSRWIDVEVQDDPRDPQRKIFLFFDVSEMHDLRRQIDEKAHFYDLIGRSKAMELVYQQVREIANADWTVLIQGETGTGKELVARALHSASHRNDKPFLALNCAGLTDTLVGSQLFGHVRGAFTGAVSDHQGVLEAADGGTLLLDEIGDLPLDIQGSLLRVLQEKEVTRLGENTPRKVDVRILAATHRDLGIEVEQGRFREDLLYRLRIARILLPPLRERREDIPVLAAAFLREVGASSGKSASDISPQAMGLLMDYDWPGNVRELRNAIEFALFRCSTTIVQADDLPPETTGSESFALRPITALPAHARILEAGASGAYSVSSPSHIEARTTAQGTPSTHLLQPVDEKSRILAALEHTRGNRTAAARLLGMSRATFYRRLADLNIQIKQK